MTVKLGRREVLDDGFRTQLSTTRVGINRWSLDAELVYEGTRQRFTAPAGFVTDFATVPWWAQWLIPRTGPWDKGAVIHDLLCSDRRRHHDEVAALLELGFDLPFALATVEPPLASAVDTDGVFRQMLRRSNTGLCRRWLMWTAVRWAALRNPCRRERWWTTLPAVTAVSLLALAAGLVLLAGWGLVTAMALRLL